MHGETHRNGQQPEVETSVIPDLRRRPLVPPVPGPSQRDCRARKAGQISERIRYRCEHPRRRVPNGLHIWLPACPSQYHQEMALRRWRLSVQRTTLSSWRSFRRTYALGCWGRCPVDAGFFRQRVSESVSSARLRLEHAPSRMVHCDVLCNKERSPSRRVCPRRQPRQLPLRGLQAHTRGLDAAWGLQPPWLPRAPATQKGTTPTLFIHSLCLGELHHENGVWLPGMEEGARDRGGERPH
jgi:hypothetical protein